MTQSDLVTVGWAYGQAEAAVVSALLGGSGIRVFPHTWYVASVQWHWTHALGGIELKVPASQAADAAELLADCPVERRPRSWQWRLLVGGVSLAVLFLCSLPPPASGFFIAGRPGASRQQEPV
ncbi:MAG: hypothetical protein ACFCUW_01970 [Kiloniellaceae bacterium]